MTPPACSTCGFVAARTGDRLVCCVRSCPHWGQPVEHATPDHLADAPSIASQAARAADLDTAARATQTITERTP